MIKSYINGYAYPIMARPDTLDSKLCTQILEEEEYENIEFYTEPKIIVDAGANIGFASIYFANKYPGAKVYAIEPEDGNFEVLQINVASYPNITPIKAALWGKEEMLHLHDPGLGVLAYQTYHDVTHEGNNGVQGITIDTLIQQYSIEHIDLLKIDIEGSEYEVFSADCAWIGKVSAMIIELHERLKSGCNKLFFSVINNRFDYEWLAGENYYFSKKRAAKPVLPERYKKENPDSLPVEQMWYMRDVMWEGEKLERMKASEQRDEAVAALAIVQKQNAEFQAQSKAAQERCDDALAHRNDALKQRDEALAWRDDSFSQRDQAFSQLQEAAAQRDEAFGQRDEAIARLNETQKQLGEANALREEALAQVTDMQAQRDDALKLRDDAILQTKDMQTQRDDALKLRDDAFIQIKDMQAQRDDALKLRDDAFIQIKDMQAQHDNALKLREKALAKCEKTQSQREKALAQRDEALAQRDEALAQRDEALAQRDEALMQHEEALAQRDEALMQHEKALAQRDEITQQYLTVCGSTSWKITKPVRYLLDRIKRYPRSKA